MGIPALLGIAVDGFRMDGAMVAFDEGLVGEDRPSTDGTN
jgi:hypothetical protein